MPVFINFPAPTSGGSGSGDVSGPGSSTDNAITRWDGTTGQLIQDSTAILEDNGAGHFLAVLQQDTIPASATLVVQSGEVYIIGEELNIDGTLEAGGTVILL